MIFKDVIPSITKGFNLKKGSLVLLHFWGEITDIEILDRFSIEVAKAGGVPVKWINSRNFIKDFYNEVPVENLNYPDKYFEIFKLADVVIDIFMYPPMPHVDFPREKMPCYRNYMRTLFPALAENKEKFIQVRVPTEENALSEGINFEIYRDSMLKAMDIDYESMRIKCCRLVDRLTGKRCVTIHTGSNKKLSLNLGERSWYRDDGDGDVPCGEIYIAPIEESSEGEIMLPEVFLDGEKHENITMKFEFGVLVGCSDEKVLDFIKSFPGDSSIIGEFGIGLNEKVSNTIGYALIDEKCLGTAHIALGMNNMFGGNNKSPLHLDMVFRPERVEIDGELLFDSSGIIL